MHDERLAECLWPLTIFFFQTAILRGHNFLALYASGMSLSVRAVFSVEAQGR